MTPNDPDISMSVMIQENDVPISVVVVRDFRWRPHHEDTLRLVLKHHWTGDRKKGRKVVIQSSSCSPARLKQVIMSAITGSKAQIGHEDPEVVKIIQDHVSEARCCEALESHRLLTLASFMPAHRARDPREIRDYMLESYLKHHMPFKKDTVQRLWGIGMTREYLITNALKQRRHWLFGDPDAWWLHL